MSTSTLLEVEKTVREFVRDKNIKVLFQPVVSVSTKSIVGFETFARPGTKHDHAPDARALFRDDFSPQLKVDMDRLCREKSLIQFKPFQKAQSNLLLFLNVNPDILEHVDPNSEVLVDQTKAQGVVPANVIIECPLCRSTHEIVLGFAERYRDYGFRFCLDDVACGESFSQAISRVKPSFIKLNRSFFADEGRAEFSDKVLQAIIDVGNRIGTAIVGRGVETESESLRLLQAGVHLQQGYYYTKDETYQGGDPARTFYKKIEQTYEKYKQDKRQQVKLTKERFEKIFAVVNKVVSKVQDTPQDRFDEVLPTLVRNNEAIIALFVVDETGQQITDHAHIRNDHKLPVPVVTNRVRGADHSANDYILYLDMGYPKFVTRPFTSHFTGENACIISKPFYNTEGGRFILCMEIPHPG